MSNNDYGEGAVEVTTLKVDDRGRTIIPQPLRRRFSIDGKRALLRIHMEPRFNLDKEDVLENQPEEIQTVEMDSRGRITVPKKVRERYGFVEDNVLIRFSISLSKILEQ